MVWPVSPVSMAEISATCFVISSPSLCIILARSAAGVAAHFGKAALAAATAACTSASPPAATSASTCWLAGLTVSKHSRLSTALPSIRWGMRISVLDRSSVTMVLSSRPRPSISHTTSSPGLTLTTPSGVPVRMMSPGNSVMKLLRYSISAGTSSIRSRVLPCCFSSPLTKVRRPKRMRVGHVGGIDQPGAERGCAVAVLHAQVGAVPVLQVVADRVVVGDGVAGDVVQRIGALDTLGVRGRSPPPARIRSA